MAAPVSRNKREISAHALYEALTMFHDALPHIEEFLKYTLKQIPKTPAYERYVNLYQGFLKNIEEFNTKPGKCGDKLMGMFAKFGTFIEEFYKEGITPEVEEIIRINKRHFDTKTLISMTDIFKNLSDMDVSEEEEEKDMTIDDAIHLYPLIYENC